MARVTVEDCIEKVDNRFELVMLASQRARKIGTGASLTVSEDNDKKTVISLREIAGETIDVTGLKEDMIQSYQKFLPQDPEDEVIDLMDGEEEWGEIADSSNIYANEETFVEDEDEGDKDGDSNPSLSDIAGV